MRFVRFQSQRVGFQYDHHDLLHADVRGDQDFSEPRDHVGPVQHVFRTVRAELFWIRVPLQKPAGNRGQIVVGNRGTFRAQIAIEFQPASVRRLSHDRFLFKKSIHKQLSSKNRVAWHLNVLFFSFGQCSAIATLEVFKLTHFLIYLHTYVRLDI